MGFVGFTPSDSHVQPERPVHAIGLLIAAMLVIVVGLSCADPDSSRAESWTALAASNTQYLPDAGAPLTPIDLEGESAKTSLSLDDFGGDVVISPDARTGYVASSTYYAAQPCKDTGPSDIQEVDLSGSTPVEGPKIEMGSTPPVGLALSPDGHTLYATSLCARAVLPIDLNSQSPTVRAPIAVGGSPLTVVASPDGSRLYVANGEEDTVSVIDLTRTPAVAVDTVPVGKAPLGMAITPDGSRLYVADSGECAVSEIDTAVLHAGPIALGSQACKAGDGPQRVAISPDGQRAYVTLPRSQTVVPIQTATETPDAPIEFATFGGFQPGGIAVSPDGHEVVVGNQLFNEHGPFGESAAIVKEPGDHLSAAAIPFAAPPSTPSRIAITPDQAPVANFTVASAPPGAASSFDASPSTVRFGSIVSYAWNFGDGTSSVSPTPTITHVYAHAGSYTATLTETDSAGTTASGEVFTGQTASSLGSASASTSRSVFVTGGAAPQVSLSTTAIGFGVVGVGHSASNILRISNTGEAPLTISASSLAGLGATSFSRSADVCTGATVPAGGSCTMTVSFAPSAAGAFTAQLAFVDNASGSPHTIVLSGAGTTSRSVVGAVYDGSKSPVIPLAGARVQVCPKGRSGVELGSPDCRYASTGADGSYSVSGLGAGTWAMQVEPPSASLFGAAADIQPQLGQLTENFTLRAPAPLSPGVSIVTPFGASSQGVPTVNWEQPFEVSSPVEIPTQGPANSEQPFAVEFTTTVGSEEAIGVAIFTIGYDREGFATSVSDVIAGAATRGGASTGNSGAGNGAIPRGSAARVRAHVACCQQAGDQILYKWPNGEGGEGVIGQTYNGTPFVDPSYNTASPGESSRLEIGNPIDLAPPIEINTPLGPIDLGKQANKAIESTPLAKLGQTLKAANQFRQKDDRQRARDLYNMAWKMNWEKATHGAGSVAQKILGPIGNKLKEFINNLYIDPSGTVHTRGGHPLAGAKVVLSRLPKRGARPVKVPSASTIMSPANRRNPDFSNAFGYFGWDVLPGLYEVTATHSGCRAAHTHVLPVPPPALDLSIALRCSGVHYAPTRTSLHAVRVGPTVLRLVARVSTRGHGRPVGIMSFRAGARLLGTSDINPRTGTASILTSLRGRSRVRASYAGDGYHAGSGTDAALHG